MLIQSFGPLLVAPSEELDSPQTAGYKRNDWNKRRSSDGTLNSAPYREYPHPHFGTEKTVSLAFEEEYACEGR